MSETEWPQVYSHQIVEGLAGGSAATVSIESVDCVAVMAWMHKDAMIAAFNRDIAELADDAAALTTAERTKREREILAAILTAERLEEMLCEQTGAPRRPDADARAILQLADSSPAPREE